MPDYLTAVCHMDEHGQLVPAESLAVTAGTDNEAIQKAVAWRIETIRGVNTDRKAWLQVLRDGIAIFSQEIGRVF
jgi:hypothetical protein